jgi:hypothetical protein
MSWIDVALDRVQGMRAVVNTVMNLWEIVK